MRGCHWEIIDNKLPLDYDKTQWQDLFRNLLKSFHQIQPSTNKYTVNPGLPNQRQQDVLDKNAQIWLIKSSSQIHPQKVTNWHIDGDKSNVRGAALDFFYSDKRFKGFSNGSGNKNVGGTLGTPSYVWIKSIFPYQNQPYQVVTIFGCDYPDRFKYAQELEKLSKQNQAVLVFGQMPKNNLKPSLILKSKRQNKI